MINREAKATRLSCGSTFSLTGGLRCCPVGHLTFAFASLLVFAKGSRHGKGGGRCDWLWDDTAVV